MWVPSYHTPRKGKMIRASKPVSHDPGRVQRFLNRLAREEHGRIALMNRGKVAKAQAKTQTRDHPTASIPFVRASHRYLDPAFDVSFLPGASAVNLGPFDIPARGYIRSIVLLVTASASVIGPGVLSEDYPFNLIDSIGFVDTNGRNIYGPVSGYDAFLTNLFGGYRWDGDPRNDPDYVGTINAQFVVRIPVEITAWDGYGSLANQASNQEYRLDLFGGAVGAAYTTAPTTAPTVRIRGYIEGWTTPADNDLQGNPQEKMPPGHGTTQYWSVFTYGAGAGAFTQKLSRVGNLIRNWIVVCRDNVTGLRSDADYPDDFTLEWNDNDLISREPQIIRRDVIESAYGRNALARPVGVFPYFYTDDQDGHPGNENRHLWLPTVQSDKIEMGGNYGAAARLRVLTNDVIPVGGR